MTVRVSPSRVKLAHACLRRWAARELFRLDDTLTFAAARGVMFHASVARRTLGLPYDYESTFAGLTPDDARTVSPFANDPKLRDVTLRLANTIDIHPPPTMVEFDVSVDVDGVTWQGRVDAARYDAACDMMIVYDYKTTSDARYAMTAEALSADVQACFYGLAALRGAFPGGVKPSRVIADWRYAETRGFTALAPVGATLTEERCLEVLRRYRPTVDKMLELAARHAHGALALQDIPLGFDYADPSVERPCEMYHHTCAFIEACQPPPIPIEVLARTFAGSAERETTNMTQPVYPPQQPVSPYPQQQAQAPAPPPQQQLHAYPPQQPVSPYTTAQRASAPTPYPQAQAQAPTPYPQAPQAAPQPVQEAQPVAQEVPAEEKVPGRGRPRKPRVSKADKQAVVRENVEALATGDVDVVQEPADGAPPVVGETQELNITEALTVMARFARTERVAFTLTPVKE